MKKINLHSWHRYIGLVSILFVIMLFITGILLNHTEELQLAKRYVQYEWVLDWYGIKTPNVYTAFPLGDTTNPRWLSAIDDQLYLDKEPMSNRYEDLRGAVEVNSFIVGLIGEQMLLFTLDGELVERLTSAYGLPTGINALGLFKEHQLIVRTPQGLFQPDAEFIDWKKLPDISNQVQWVLSQPPPHDLRHTLTARVRSKILPWERVLLDMHSGRLFGTWGVYIIDFVAILLSILALTGSLIWLRKMRK